MFEIVMLFAFLYAATCKLFVDEPTTLLTEDLSKQDTL